MDSTLKKAVLLAAGKGTRMKSRTPKVLHEIMGKTLLERVLKTIEPIDFSETFVIVGHQADVVEESLEQLNREDIKCVLQEPQLGTGHAVFQAYDHLKDFNGTLVILCADTPLLMEETISKLLEYHESSQSSVSVLSAKLDSPTGYGRIVRDDDGNVQKIIEEKDASTKQKQINEINAGVYCIEWEDVSQAFFDLSSNNAQCEYYLTDIVEWASKKGLKVQAHCLTDEEEIFGVNSRVHLAEAAAILNKRIIENLLTEGVTIVDPGSTWISPETHIEPDCTILPGCYIEGENYFAKECVIGPNVYIKGNVDLGENTTVTMSKLSDVVAGENCQIGPFANLRNKVVLADNVRIGNFVEVKNTTISHETNAAHLAYLGDAEIGSDVNVGAGTITANYDSLKKIKNKTVIKDNVKIGSNSVLVAPVTINEGANVAAGSVITKDVPENSLAIARGKQSVIENWVEKKKKQIISTK